MAVRIAGVTLPSNKKVMIALSYLYGVGQSQAQRILNQVGVDENRRMQELSNIEVERIKNYIEKNYKVEGELRREILLNIKRLKEIRSYRGVRHEKHLPMHGQRTKTNSRTVRGNKRVTMGSGKRLTGQKT